LDKISKIYIKLLCDFEDHYKQI